MQLTTSNKVNYFSIIKSTFHLKVVNVVNEVFKNEVWWPKGDNQMEMIKGFKDLLGLPGI
jgi:hypothetical protein